MTINDMKIYIVTSDKYNHLLEIHSYLFNKFWGTDREVIILGYKEPDFKLPSNFKFESLGVDTGPNGWSNGLIDYIQKTGESHFILSLDDMPLTGKVNFNKLNKMVEYCDDDTVGRICLIRDTVHRPHKTFDVIDEEFSVIEALQSAEYRISTFWSIWNKEYFLNLIKPNMSPWNFELNASSRAKNDGYHILGTKSSNGPPDNSPIDCCNLMWKGQGYNFGKVNYPHLGHEGKLEQEVVDEMRNEGLIEPSQDVGVVYARTWKYYD